MLLRSGPAQGPNAVDDPTFSMSEVGREWHVGIIWADGTGGPTLAFASRDDAETWVARDARSWLVRLAQVMPAGAHW